MNTLQSKQHELAMAELGALLGRHYPAADPMRVASVALQIKAAAQLARRAVEAPRNGKIAGMAAAKALVPMLNQADLVDALWSQTGRHPDPARLEMQPGKGLRLLTGQDEGYNVITYKGR